MIAMLYQNYSPIKKRLIVELFCNVCMLLSKTMIMSELELQTQTFDSGHGNKKRLLNITELARHYGDPMCSSMVALHAFTGCDFTSCFKGKGKVTALEILLKFPGFGRLFQDLGTSWNKAEDLVQEAEKFVCAMYGKPKLTSVDKLRFLLLKA